jgi:hypothetical protein
MIYDAAQPLNFNFGLISFAESLDPLLKNGEISTTDIVSAIATDISLPIYLDQFDNIIEWLDDNIVNLTNIGNCVFDTAWDTTTSLINFKYEL